MGPQGMALQGRMEGEGCVMGTMQMFARTSALGGIWGRETPSCSSALATGGLQQLLCSIATRTNCWSDAQCFGI